MVACLPLIAAGVVGLYGVILIAIFFIYTSSSSLTAKESSSLTAKESSSLTAKDQRDAVLTAAVCAAAALAGRANSRSLSVTTVTLCSHV